MQTGRRCSIRDHAGSGHSVTGSHRRLPRLRRCIGIGRGIWLLRAMQNLHEPFRSPPRQSHPPRWHLSGTATGWCARTASSMRMARADTGTLAISWLIRARSRCFNAAKLPSSPRANFETRVSKRARERGFCRPKKRSRYRRPSRGVGAGCASCSGHTAPATVIGWGMQGWHGSLGSSTWTRAYASCRRMAVIGSGSPGWWDCHVDGPYPKRGGWARLVG